MRLRLNNFLSTPRFILTLTEISQKLGEMKDVSKKEKTEILKKDLHRIN